MNDKPNLQSLLTDAAMRPLPPTQGKQTKPPVYVAEGPPLSPFQLLSR